LHDGEVLSGLDQYRNLPMKMTFDTNKTDIPIAKELLHLLTNKIDNVDPAYQL
jgi:hypothetical protein